MYLQQMPQIPSSQVSHAFYTSSLDLYVVSVGIAGFESGPLTPADYEEEQAWIARRQIPWSICQPSTPVGLEKVLLAGILVIRYIYADRSKITFCGTLSHEAASLLIS